uniref:Uncharacterized protein n=1 Tax=Anguilla anguilla TaxID=7936 RepID=A0A0E9QYP4_ANGAN
MFSKSLFAHFSGMGHKYFRTLFYGMVFITIIIIKVIN